MARLRIPILLTGKKLEERVYYGRRKPGTGDTDCEDNGVGGVGGIGGLGRQRGKTGLGGRRTSAGTGYAAAGITGKTFPCDPFGSGAGGRGSSLLGNKGYGLGRGYGGLLSQSYGSKSGLGGGRGGGGGYGLSKYGRKSGIGSSGGRGYSSGGYGGLLSQTYGRKSGLG